MSDSDLILLVEDSPTQAAHMQFILEDAGFRVAVAVDGRAGLEKVRAEQPLLVVTDLHMPEMNGLELVQQLRREFASLPVILTTAAGTEDIATEALQRGAASYVPKRKAETMLVETVRQILALSRADRMARRLIECQTSSHLTFSLYNDDSLVPAVIARIRDQLLEMGICDDAAIMPVSTAIDESLVNAMIHGNLEVSSKLRDEDSGKPYRNLISERRNLTPYRDRRVHIELTTNRDEACIVIRDEGPGFDPSKIPDPRDPANIEKVSGRGLLLIHTFMDEVRHNGQGNEITMIKRRAVTAR
ncbi:MAG: response regulator [Planctomycetaceae bacterium]|nr:response regulator [Planctomycetales bacterium]MCB9927006.1 response regulator [Planctomycetaceae bacterium]